MGCESAGVKKIEAMFAITPATTSQLEEVIVASAYRSYKLALPKKPIQFFMDSEALIVLSSTNCFCWGLKDSKNFFAFCALIVNLGKHS
jgi:hypothetical protein